MRIFDHFSEVSVCPICKTSDDKPCILAGIDGTEEGNIEQAMPIHLDCIQLRVSKADEIGFGFLYQVYDKGSETNGRENS